MHPPSGAVAQYSATTGPAVQCNSGGGGPLSSRCELGEGGGSGNGLEGPDVIVPHFQNKKKGGEPDLPNLCVNSRVSAISDVPRCLWWVRPLEPN